jgi:UDP-glucose 4-epimerase
VPAITQTAIGKLPTMHVWGNDYDTRDGSCLRDYIHVCDIAHAHTLALNLLFGKQNKVNPEIFNLGTGDGFTVLEVIHAFEKTSGVKLNYTVGPRRGGDVVAIYANNNKAKTELNWQPKYSLDQMMDSAWKWELALQKA